MKRKRPGRVDAACPTKRPKVDQPFRPAFPVLDLYYPRVLTLRDYLLSTSHQASRSRRRLLAGYGRDGDNGVVGRLLDQVIVGAFATPHATKPEDTQAIQNQEFGIFSQQVNESTICSGSSASSQFQSQSQSEVGDESFVYLMQE